MLLGTELSWLSITTWSSSTSLLFLLEVCKLGFARRLVESCPGVVLFALTTLELYAAWVKTISLETESDTLIADNPSSMLLLISSFARRSWRLRRFTDDSNLPFSTLAAIAASDCMACT